MHLHRRATAAAADADDEDEDEDARGMAVPSSNPAAPTSGLWTRKISK